MTQCSYIIMHIIQPYKLHNMKSTPGRRVVKVVDKNWQTIDTYQYVISTT